MSTLFSHAPYSAGFYTISPEGSETNLNIEVPAYLEYRKNIDSLNPNSSARFSEVSLELTCPYNSGLRNKSELVVHVKDNQLDSLVTSNSDRTRYDVSPPEFLPQLGIMKMEIRERGWQ